MYYDIKPMLPEKLEEYAELYMSVFNSAPYYDVWTAETASARIKSIMSTETFAGKTVYTVSGLAGMICGQKEPYYDGMHFHIQEFCVLPSAQRSGLGTALLRSLREELSKDCVKSIYVVTSKNTDTEVFLYGQGFVSSNTLIIMSDSEE